MIVWYGGMVLYGMAPPLCPDASLGLPKQQQSPVPLVGMNRGQVGRVLVDAGRATGVEANVTPREGRKVFLSVGLLPFDRFISPPLVVVSMFL